MFDKLEDLLRRFEEIQNELSEPTVVSDQNRFRKLMKEQIEKLWIAGMGTPKYGTENSLEVPPKTSRKGLTTFKVL